MSGKGRSCNKYEDIELRRGPWTLEKDTLLIHYIACHGEGRWNVLVIQLLIKISEISAHKSRHFPHFLKQVSEIHGRTDNEIKYYWRTPVQKQARQLKIDANRTMFRDAIGCYGMPRLLEETASPKSKTPHAETAATRSRPSPTESCSYQAGNDSSRILLRMSYLQERRCSF
ncbi:hypothetical protein BHE74_00032138 [Ensete ventricosum]|uniref:Uncharacterized protein n=1 Tax=Ensete ventricosum TaxID=4639 RepID=A0A444F841_ENSVE|nr:hypothetical protein B296_00020458 [Ensete ventricosum]RWW18767.1 hypothetical protein GW17_00017223 [Ensete ventricosum]RWW60839.1 hypothetical protein BHE74_00032138 [Ensete ventricosum]RZR83420.1 hypothetical protein BHM03_00010021 [Ensete ventricosum]